MLAEPPSRAINLSTIVLRINLPVVLSGSLSDRSTGTATISPSESLPESPGYCYCSRRGTKLPYSRFEPRRSSSRPPRSPPHRPSGHGQPPAVDGSAARASGKRRAVQQQHQAAQRVQFSRRTMDPSGCRGHLQKRRWQPTASTSPAGSPSATAASSSSVCRLPPSGLLTQALLPVTPHGSLVD